MIQRIMHEENGSLYWKRPPGYAFRVMPTGQLNICVDERSYR